MSRDPSKIIGTSKTVITLSRSLAQERKFHISFTVFLLAYRDLERSADAVH
jgi:hypothetical protein